MFQNLRFTTTQTFVLHALVSLLLGAITSGVTVAGQAIFQTGANPSVIISTGLAAFLAWFTHGFVSLRGSAQATQAVQDTGAQFGQAERDMLSGLDAKVTALTGNHADLVGAVNALYQQVAASPQAAQLAAMVTEAVTQRLQAALPSLIAQHAQMLAPTPQPFVKPANPANTSQVPFPPAGNTATASTWNPSTPPFSFGDTGIVPVAPGK
jgi:hypothetical protein